MGLTHAGKRLWELIFKQSTRDKHDDEAAAWNYDACHFPDREAYTSTGHWR